MTASARDLAVERLLRREEVTELLLRYCELVDANRQAEVLDLFEEGATYDHGHGRLFTGRADLARLFAQLDLNEASSHHLSNVRVMLGPDGSATCRSYLYAYHRRTTGEVVQLWGRYHDTVVRRDGAWRFRHRALLAAAEDGVAPDPGWPSRYQLIERIGRH